MNRLPVFIIMFLVGLSQKSFAIHPVSISWIHADIQQDKIALTMKITSEDLLYFHKIASDSLFYIDGSELRQAALEHTKILQNAIQINDQNSHLLSSQFVESNLSSIQEGEKFDIMNLMQYPLLYRFEVTMEENTDELLFQQFLEKYQIPTIVNLSISSQGKVLVDNVKLDGNSPYSISRYATESEISLPVSNMIGYYSITNNTIAYELSIPYKILNSFHDSNQDSDILDLMEIESFLKANSSVLLNQKNIEPKIMSVNSLEGYQTKKNNSIVNIHVIYSLEELPRELQLNWTGYNWNMRWFENFTDEFGEQKKFRFSRFKKSYKVQIPSTQIIEQ